MKKKYKILATLAAASGVLGFIYGKKKNQVAGLPECRPIEPVKAEDVGFEDYGHLKDFTGLDKNRKVKVLITGAGSYIGESFKDYANDNYPNIEITTIDMQDPSWRDFDFSPFDTVFHVAGIAHADVGNTSLADQERYYAINTDLAIETAKYAKESGCKQFIFMSSMIVYGGKEYIDEHTIPAPANFYGNSKWLADVGVRRLANEQFKVAVLRPPMIYGKGSKGNYPTLAKIAVKTPFFPSIRNKRSMLYIENLCEFIAQLTLSQYGGVYFPQNSEYTQTYSMVRDIAQAHGKEVHPSGLLSVGVMAARVMPVKKIRGLAEKAFGSSYYERNLSEYKGLDYQRVSLEESILRTED